MQPARSRSDRTGRRHRRALLRASIATAGALLVAASARAVPIVVWDAAGASGQDVAVLTSAANPSASADRGTGSNVILEGDVAALVPAPESGTALMGMIGLFWLAVVGRSRRRRQACASP